MGEGIWDKNVLLDPGYTWYLLKYHVCSKVGIWLRDRRRLVCCAVC